MSLDYSNQTNDRPAQSTLIERLEQTRARQQEQQRRHIESIARPGESYEQTHARWLIESDDKMAKKTETANTILLRKAPKGDAQQDFFVPPLYDVGTRDSRSIMNIAVFRLSKRDRRVGEVITYELPDGVVKVSAGAEGMAQRVGLRSCLNGRFTPHRSDESFS